MRTVPTYMSISVHSEYNSCQIVQHDMQILYVVSLQDTIRTLSIDSKKKLQILLL